MATEYTPNYGLKKPDQLDFYNIDDHNENSQIIDAAMKEIDEKRNAHEEREAPHIGHETPQGAQEKADKAEDNARGYTDQEVGALSDEVSGHKAQMATQNTAGHIKLSDIPSPDLSAENISLDSENFTSDDVKGGMEELFQSVNSGKDLVRNAVVDMNQNVPSVPTFLELANAIMNISSDANANEIEVLSGRTFYQGGVKRTGTMANRTGHVNAQSHTRFGTTLRFRPQAGYYDGSSGNSVQRSDSNFTASNIKKGVSIFGVVGNAEEARSANGVITLALHEEGIIDLPFDINFAIIHTHGIGNFTYGGFAFRTQTINGSAVGNGDHTNRGSIVIYPDYTLVIRNTGGGTFWWNACGFSDILIP